MSATPFSDSPHARLVRLIEHGDFAGACEMAAAARQRHPHDGELARLHGLALHQFGRSSEARTALEEACRLLPRRVEPLCNLASVLLASGDAPAALDTLKRAESLAPGHPAVLNGLGNARRASADLAGARDAYAAAARSAPGHVPSLLNLAACELALGEPEASLAIAQRVLAHVPQHPEAWLLTGQGLAATGRPEQALHAYAQGERHAPHDARFPYHIGLLHEDARRIRDAADAQARTVQLDPTLGAALGQLLFLRRQLCEWTGLEGLSARVRERVAAGAGDIAPFGFLSEPASAGEQLQCARAFAREVQAHAGQSLPTPAPRASGRPVVGFVSNGFGEHPTGLLTVAAFEALARRAELDLHLFATAPADGGPIRRRLANAAQIHELAGLPPRRLAERIRSTDVELLVDLRGWGGGSVAAALALRPAPLQAGWLAYPGTSGASWLDYVIADRIVLPEPLVPAFSETVAWLPRCFQPSDNTREVPVPPARHALGLPDEGVVYACFNNSYKVEPRGFGRMLAVLEKVPGSVLWLLSGPGDSDRRLAEHARAAGIDPSRLVFAPKRPHLEYLAQYQHVDLFLDTPWYNAHTTASDALWAGCPLLTTAGETFASRVAASLNHHLGMAAMNVDSDQDYVREAVRLGRDAGARAALRQTLAERRVDSGLFDMDGFAADFSALLGALVERQRRGLAPAAIG